MPEEQGDINQKDAGRKAGVTIERLSLQLSGLSERDGRQLAQLITNGLAAAGLSDSRRYAIGAVRISMEAPTDVGMDRLAEQIVADIVRQIRRTT
jgi:hypothetical protein